MPGLLSAPLGQLGAGALVTLIVLMILTGKLVTRRQLLDTQADRDKWKAAADEWQKTATQQGMTLERLVAGQETANHVLEEIQAVQHRAAGGSAR